MPNYKRPRRGGSTIFFTVNLAERGSDLLVSEIDTLRAAFHHTWLDRPWVFEAIVVLPDRLHAVVSLPLGDSDYATRWRLIKARFSRQMPKGPQRVSHVARRERGIWQRQFWEHHIRDRADYWAHIRYCWQAPVACGLVERVVDWEYSSFQRDVLAGRVRADWGCRADI